MSTQLTSIIPNRIRPWQVILTAALTATHFPRVIAGSFILLSAYRGTLPEALVSRDGGTLLVGEGGTALVGFAAPFVIWGLLKQVGLTPWLTAVLWNTVGLMIVIYSIAPLIAAGAAPLTLLPPSVVTMTHIANLVLLGQSDVRRYYLAPLDKEV